MKMLSLKWLVEKVMKATQAYVHSEGSRKGAAVALTADWTSYLTSLSRRGGNRLLHSIAVKNEQTSQQLACCGSAGPAAFIPTWPHYLTWPSQWPFWMRTVLRVRKREPGSERARLLFEVSWLASGRARVTFLIIWIPSPPPAITYMAMKEGPELCTDTGWGLGTD